MKLLALGACLAVACCTSNSARMAATGNVWQLKNECEQRRASGVPFAIRDGELWLLTAKHVPQPAQGWSAHHRDGAILGEGRVVSMHPTEDAAVMAFPIGDYAPHLVSPNYAPLELGEQVYGAGWGGGHYLWLTQGLVSGPDRATTQIALGDSGGGIFNEEGELVAILVARYNNDAHMAAVVPLADIETWLKKNLEYPVADAG